MFALGSNLSVKLKPTKYPKGKSKKVYRGILTRPLGHFNHLYHIQSNLYIVPLLKDKYEPSEWIDNNYEKIIERIKLLEERYGKEQRDSSKPI
jgi:hypothetical protein